VALLFGTYSNASTRCGSTMRACLCASAAAAERSAAAVRKLPHHRATRRRGHLHRRGRLAAQALRLAARRRQFLGGALGSGCGLVSARSESASCPAASSAASSCAAAAAAASASCRRARSAPPRLHLQATQTQF